MLHLHLVPGPFCKTFETIINNRLDDFLQWLHCMLLMDDTIILATSREAAVKKLGVLTDFCRTSGMVVDMSKTKFMVINGRANDKDPLVTEDLVVDNCDSYTYLGVIFTQDGKSDSTVREHVRNKQCHIIKFLSFLSKNPDAPFSVRKTVFEAAISSTLLYGCDSWLGSSPRYANHPCMTALKALLGVRATTTYSICLLKLGLPSSEARVKAAQNKILTDIL